MSYEEEQSQLSQEYKQLKMKCDILSEYFKNNPQKKINSVSDGFNFQRDRLEQVALNKGLSNYFRDSNEYLSYRLMTIRLAEIEHRLNQSRTQRAVTDGIKFMGSITPQHVSGRLYKVENGNGCGMFCLWFIVIDAIICLLIFLIHG